MKKLIFLFVAFLTVGFLTAQNVSTTKTTGDHNDSKTVQTGDLQDAAVEQEGDYNDVDVDQFTDNEGPQEANAYQKGDRNDATIDMDQTGGGGNTPANTADIDQIGDWNKSYQKTNAPGYNSGQHVTGYQEGDHNDLKQFIYNGYNTNQYSKQLGDRNKSIQKSWGAYKDLDIVSDGDYNEAYQTAKSAKADLDIDQLGDRNFAKQYFEGSFGFVSGNTGDIDQTGSWNESHQLMDGKTGVDMAANIIGDHNFTYQKSEGDRDDATAFISGDRNESRMYQDGDDNGASLWSVGDRNEFYQKQEGDDNGQRFYKVVAIGTMVKSARREMTTRLM
ncbi:MAG: hypothetical protein U5L09_12615 [Bacteroidales bacterium]|nr:hypothetical protein [Bacteroidales bacterium]